MFTTVTISSLQQCRRSQHLLQTQALLGESFVVLPPAPLVFPLFLPKSRASTETSVLARRAGLNTPFGRVPLFSSNSYEALSILLHLDRGKSAQSTVESGPKSDTNQLHMPKTIDPSIKTYTYGVTKPRKLTTRRPFPPPGRRSKTCCNDETFKPNRVQKRQDEISNTEDSTPKTQVPRSPNGLLPYSYGNFFELDSCRRIGTIYSNPHSPTALGIRPLRWRLFRALDRTTRREAG